MALLVSSDLRSMLSILRSILDEHGKGGLSIDSSDPMQRTALHEAAKAGTAVAAKFCLSRGAEPSPCDAWDSTPLDDAVRGCHKDVRLLLLEAGARLGSIKTAAAQLFAAIGNGDAPLVESIVSAGCPVNVLDDDNRTPLHHAAAKGDVTILSFLINAGAKLDPLDNFGLTPLGEAARHSSRTGHNRIRDRLMAAGADDSPVDTTKTNKFLGVMAVLQLVFIVLFATCTRYDPATTHASDSPDAMKTTYSMFMDVHVMIFIGFGYLMTFLRKYGHSSVGINFLVGAFIIQWHILCGGFFEQVFGDVPFHKIQISLNSLLLADFAAAVVLITFGALLGKVSPLQILVLGFFEMVFFAVNEQLLLRIGILDVGGSIIVHLFGAYFGLAASWCLSAKSAGSNANNSSVYHSDLFAMIGTVFLWIYWPSFVASPAGPRDQQRAVIATTLSLAGSCVAAFSASLWLRKGKFSMVDVQNATLAGGVAIGSAANLAVLSPAEALTIGVCGGLLSVCGYAVIQPKLERQLGLHDTCGVNNLHGMPAILAGVCSAIVVAYSGDASVWIAAGVDEPGVNHVNATSYNDVFGGLPSARGKSQAGYQLACVAVSFVMAVAGGLLSAMLVKPLGSPEEEMLFLDKADWEVPNFELPFYFDRRGEINREGAADIAELEASKHGGQMMPMLLAESSAPRGAANFNGLADRYPPMDVPRREEPLKLISNELLSMKLDLILQGMGKGDASGIQDRAQATKQLPSHLAGVRGVSSEEVAVSAA